MEQNKLSTVLREMRLRKKLTWRKLSRSLSRPISAAYLNRIELHNEIPSHKLLCELAAILEFDEEYLIELARSEKRKISEEVIRRSYPTFKKI